MEDITDDKVNQDIVPDAPDQEVQTQTEKAHESRTVSKRVLIVVIAVLVLIIIGLVFMLNKKGQAPTSNASITTSTLAGTENNADISANAAEKQSVTNQDDTVSESNSPSTQTSPEPKPAQSEPVATIANGSTLTIDEVSTKVPTYYGEPGLSTFKKIGFTIYNNSSSEQTYYSYSTDGYVIRALTPNKEYIDPVALAGSSEWQSSTLAAGGTAKGYVLFELDADIKTLEWKVPTNKDTLYYKIAD